MSRGLSIKETIVLTNHRFLKFSCWFPVCFLARLLRVNTLPLSLSQETDGFRCKMSKIIGRWLNASGTMAITQSIKRTPTRSTTISNLSTLDFELDTYGTLTIEAHTDDQGWPTPHRTSIRWAMKPPHSIRGSRNARIAHGRAYENRQRQLRLPDRC